MTRKKITEEVTKKRSWQDSIKEENKRLVATVNDLKRDLDYYKRENAQAEEDYGEVRRSLVLENNKLKEEIQINAFASNRLNSLCLSLHSEREDLLARLNRINLRLYSVGHKAPPFLTITLKDQEECWAWLSDKRPESKGEKDA